MSKLLDPRGTWSDGGAYDEQARRLAELFHENFLLFENEVSTAIASGGLPAVRGGPS
jgi:phosphoenolpyruvate carboxykinase (ATP)